MRQEYSYLRQRMVRSLEAQGIWDRRVLEAMGQIPRHLFVPDHLVGRAYGDSALPIGEGQTISQPWVVARMTELLEVEAEHSVLEIGTGSGYHTAILAKLARWVFSLERIPPLSRQAMARMRELGIENVKIQTFDGSVGWSEVGPFDRILVTAGSPTAPPPLLEQLRTGGRLLVPEGSREEQRLVLYEKSTTGIRKRVREAVIFVPLLGRHGWSSES